MVLQNNDYSCLLCSDPVEEMVELLFFTCSFSVQCWRILGVDWGPHDDRLTMLTKGKMPGIGICSWRCSLWLPGGFGRREITSTSDKFSPLCSPGFRGLSWILSCYSIDQNIA